MSARGWGGGGRIPLILEISFSFKLRATPGLELAQKESGPKENRSRSRKFFLLKQFSNPLSSRHNGDDVFSGAQSASGFSLPEIATASQPSKDTYIKQREREGEKKERRIESMTFRSLLRVMRRRWQSKQEIRRWGQKERGWEGAERKRRR